MNIVCVLDPVEEQEDEHYMLLLVSLLLDRNTISADDDVYITISTDDDVYITTYRQYRALSQA